MKKINFQGLKKWIILIVILLVTNLTSYYVGSRSFYMAADVYPHGNSMKYPHWYKTSEALDYERELSNALFEGLHRFYSNPDNEVWYNSFMCTPEYCKIDSLVHGNWEDFYEYETPVLEDWYSIYGVHFEPSENEKDSILNKGFQLPEYSALK